MKKVLKFGSPVLTVILFALAGILLFGSSIGGANAALTYFSETYSSRVEMFDIGVTLNENGTGVSWRNYKANSNAEWNEHTGVLLENRWSDTDPFQIGKTYDEVISATNSGTINEYVRVNLYTYWVKVEVDEEGNKQETKLQTRDPSLIDLHFDENYVGEDKYWLLDEKASTPERKVLYYNRVLEAGKTTVPLTDTLTIDSTIAVKVTQTETEIPDGKRITTTYDYDGVEFRIEAEVDAVQTHNAEDAIWSAWGRRVSISGGVDDDDVNNVLRLVD
ncbi:MAG: hypothetical protein HDR23_03150 [Lachnospiraceae bacterium]|nr:hypothetical protein [Lachnospiraceae bacterium]